MSTAVSIMASVGYQSLLQAVEKDEAGDYGFKFTGRYFHDYRAKLDWVVQRATHYAEKTGLSTEEILNAWEQDRTYWYMNYYQDCNQPEITSDRVRVFETLDEFKASIGTQGFRCPHCRGVSTNSHVCDSGVVINKIKCDWKVYGLFRDLGQGVTVFVKEIVRGQLMFMPIAWETKR